MTVYVTVSTSDGSAIVEVTVLVVATGAKLAASKNLAKVVLLFTIAPVKSFPGVTVFTFNKIAVIILVTLLKVSVGLGS
mgnify:CR=1 FL=1